MDVDIDFVAGRLSKPQNHNESIVGEDVKQNNSSANLINMSLIDYVMFPNVLVDKSLNFGRNYKKRISVESEKKTQSLNKRCAIIFSILLATPIMYWIYMIKGGDNDFNLFLFIFVGIVMYIVTSMLGLLFSFLIGEHLWLNQYSKSLENSSDFRYSKNLELYDFFSPLGLTYKKAFHKQKDSIQYILAVSKTLMSRVEALKSNSKSDLELIERTKAINLSVYRAFKEVNDAGYSERSTFSSDANKKLFSSLVDLMDVFKEMYVRLSEEESNYTHFENILKAFNNDAEKVNKDLVDSEEMNEFISSGLDEKKVKKLNQKLLSFFN